MPDSDEKFLRKVRGFGKKRAGDMTARALLKVCGLSILDTPKSRTEETKKPKMVARERAREGAENSSNQLATPYEVPKLEKGSPLGKTRYRNSE